jgi:hypothetical protein
LPKLKLFFVVATSISSLFSPLNLQAAPLKPVSISYSIGLDSSKFGNATLGKIKTNLSTTKNGYAIESVTRFQGMAAIITGNNHQESCEFQIKDGKAITNQYSGGRIGKDEYNVGFDWQARKVNFNKKQSMDMPQGYVVDNCVMWFAAALLKGEGLDQQVMYVVDGNKKRIRGFKQRSSELVNIDTKLGEKDVIKLVFERELRPERTLTFWLSPENQYLPLKIQESRKSRTTTFEIESLELLES